MQPHLLIETSIPPRTVALDRPGGLIIGRARDTDLPLNDSGISRRHCSLVLTPEGFAVEDLGSQGHTFVNDREILGRVNLRDGDRIRIGSTTLRFVASEREVNAPARLPTPPVEADATFVRRPGRSAGTPTPTPVSALASAPPPESIPLGPQMVLGRDPQCDVPLASREISRRHAEIRFVDGKCTVRDLSSANGTFLDGTEVRGRMPMKEGSRLRIGPFTFLLRGGRLVPASQKGKIRIELRNLTKIVANATTGQPLTLLEEVSLVIEPNQFVALLGPSGSGKSTLMDAINGRRPATTGQVLVNGEDFYQSYRYYRRAIGYVPQQDIVHATLTVEQAFRFTARLRLPPDTSDTDRSGILDEVIARMGLTERRHTLISHLSGGQLKRVSLGAELIADPGLLFLDEATSGLDAGTEAKMMNLFREVANEGKTVVCITHNVENIGLCDRVVVLARGKLIYYGPPDELPGFFGVSSVSEVYDHIESRSVEECAKRYRDSRFYVPITEKAHASAEVVRPATESSASGESGRQFAILTARYFTLLAQDRRNLILLLAQAPLIGILIGAVFGGNLSGQKEHLVVFLMAISAIWFGCINACREIVKELPIYLRERAVNLELLPYLGSKVAVLSGLCAAQCLALYLIVAGMTGLEGSGVQQFLTLCLTSGCGMLLGLVVSALMSNADKAMAVIPVLLIPQVILADSIVKLGDGMRLLAQWLVPAFWSVSAMLGTLPNKIGGLKHEWDGDMLALAAMATSLVCLAAAALKRKDIL